MRNLYLICCLLIMGCSPTSKTISSALLFGTPSPNPLSAQTALIDEAYKSGEISTEKYLDLKQEIAIQKAQQLQVTQKRNTQTEQLSPQEQLMKINSMNSSQRIKTNCRFYGNNMYCD